MIPHSRPMLQEANIRAVEAALRDRCLSQGPQGIALETAINELYPTRSAVAVSSGTAALYIALTLLELPLGGEVIIPSYTCNSLFSAVSHAGLTPVCADVDENSAVLSAKTVQMRVTKKTVAVIVPHTFGIRAPISQIRALGFPVIEDCAQCLGGRNADGNLLGSDGDLAVLSFFATKPIAGGEGGTILMPDHLVGRARRLRDCDESDPDPLAFNFKMSDIHAALIRSTLTELAPMSSTRNQLATRFDHIFGSTALHLNLAQSETPQALCFRYLIQTTDTADALLKKFAATGICARRPIWKPLHLTTGDLCPNTDRFNHAFVSIPLFPGLDETEIDHILHTSQAIIGGLLAHE